MSLAKTFWTYSLLQISCVYDFGHKNECIHTFGYSVYTSPTHFTQNLEVF